MATTHKKDREPLEVTPRFYELSEETREQVNKFINSCASFRNNPELLDIMLAATQELEVELFRSCLSSIHSSDEQE